MAALAVSCVLACALTAAPTTTTVSSPLAVTLYASTAEIRPGGVLNMVVAVQNRGSAAVRIFEHPNVALVSANGHEDDHISAPEDYFTITMRIESRQAFNAYDRAAANVYSGGLAPGILSPGATIAMPSGVQSGVIREGDLRVQAFIYRGGRQVAASNVWVIRVRERNG